jgi:hypothetical protein
VREQRTRRIVFSLFLLRRQCCSFPIQRNRDKRSTRKFAIGVFTQPGSKADLTARMSDFRFTPESGLRADIVPCPFRAMNGSEKPSFDYFIGAGEQGSWYLYPHFLGGPEVYH